MRLRRLTPLLAAGLLVPAAPAAAQDPTTLVVVETARVQAAPDTATINATVRRRAGRPAVARRRVERRLAEILRALDGLGVPRTDVQTEAVQRLTTRRRGRLSHIAQTTLRIRTRDLAKVGPIIDALGGANVDGPEFEVTDSTAARQQATATALARARTRADAAAAAVGQRVVAIRRVDLNPEFGYDVGVTDRSSALRGGEDEAGGGGATIEPGQEDVLVAVAVVYEIAP